VQKPHPPIYIGGNGEHTLRRVIQYGDAWMPIPGRGAQIGDRMKELQEMASAAGRGTIPVTVYGTMARDEVVGHYRDIGVDRCIFWLPSASADEVMPALDRYVSLMESVAKAGA
jgi:hypothetical protein